MVAAITIAIAIAAVAIRRAQAVLPLRGGADG